MQKKFRLYRRGNGMYYAQDRETGARFSLDTQNKEKVGDLFRAKNEAAAQPTFNREIAEDGCSRGATHPPKFATAHSFPW